MAADAHPIATHRRRSGGVGRKTASVAGGALGVWALFTFAGANHGDEDPYALVLSLYGLNVVLAAASFVLSTRRRVWGASLGLSVVSALSATVLVVLFAG